MASLLIAQQLCFHLAELAGQRMSCLEPTALLIPTTTALGVAKLREEFDHVFGELFAALCGPALSGAERRGGHPGLLWLLRSSHKEQRDLSEVQRNPSMSDTTSLSDVAARYPALSEDCAWLGQSNLHARFGNQSPGCTSSSTTIATAAASRWRTPSWPSIWLT